jgi:hypothetical protein
VSWVEWLLLVRRAAGVVRVFVFVLVRHSVLVVVLITVEDAVIVGVIVSRVGAEVVLVLVGEAVLVGVIVIGSAGLERIVFVLVVDAVSIKVLVPVEDAILVRRTWWPTLKAIPAS